MLKRYNEFYQPAHWFEYLVLYFFSALFILMTALAIVNHFPLYLSVISGILFLAFTYRFKQQASARKQYAERQYQRYLQQQSIVDLTSFYRHLRANDPEMMLVAKRIGLN